MVNPVLSAEAGLRKFRTDRKLTGALSTTQGLPGTGRPEGGRWRFSFEEVFAWAMRRFMCEPSKDTLAFDRVSEKEKRGSLKEYREKQRRQTNHMASQEQIVLCPVKKKLLARFPFEEEVDYGRPDSTWF